MRLREGLNCRLGSYAVGVMNIHAGRDELALGKERPLRRSFSGRGRDRRD